MLLSQYVPSNSQLTLVYSEPKIGKSHFAASAIAVAKKKWLMVSNGNGLDTYFGDPVKKAFPNIDLSKVELVEVENDTSLDKPQAFDKVRQQVLYHWLEKPELLSQLEGVIIEDCSKINRSAMNLAIAVNGDGERSKTLVNAMSKHNKYRGYALWTESDYGKEMEFVRTFFDDLTATCKLKNIHLIALAHESQIYIKKKNEKEKDVQVLDKITSSFTGKKEPTYMSQYFDNVIRLTRTGKEANMKVVAQCIAGTIANGAMVDAGNRLGVLKTFEDNLTFGEMMKRISARNTPPSNP